MKTKHAHLLLECLDEIYKNYKHVAIKIESYWGTEICHEYLLYLLIKDRDREGFTFGTYMMLMALYVIHSEQFSDFDKPLQLSEMNIKSESIPTELIVFD